MVFAPFVLFLVFHVSSLRIIGPTDPLSSPSHKIPVAPKSTTVTLTSRANSAQAAGSILVQIESPARLASFGRTHAKTTLPASTPTYLFSGLHTFKSNSRVSYICWISGILPNPTVPGALSTPQSDLALGSLICWANRWPASRLEVSVGGLMAQRLGAYKQ